jgi:hypothetical protein
MLFSTQSMSPYDERGVDVTLIDWFLSLTPAERVKWLDDFVDFAEEAWRLNGIKPYFANSENAQ